MLELSNRLSNDVWEKAVTTYAVPAARAQTHGSHEGLVIGNNTLKTQADGVSSARHSSRPPAQSKARFRFTARREDDRRYWGPWPVDSKRITGTLAPVVVSRCFQNAILELGSYSLQVFFAVGEIVMKRYIRFRHRWVKSLAMTALILCLARQSVDGFDGKLESLEEQAFKQAAAFVDPSLVRIDTVGGLEQIGELTLGTGPTSGMLVSEDGFVISSSFNFVSKPASILVTLSDGRRFPAKLIASDKLKLLTLLKIEAAGLTPAKSAPRASVKVGQWAIALGRTFDLGTPSISVGIVSATNRIWGKAIQTDAKTSPVNYGGALVNIEGKVLGVIAPLSPMGHGETAGVEWYDGGIGFAIPLDDVYESLDRLKQGRDLLPGLLGVTFAGGQSMNVPVVVDRVRYNSPAQRMGLKTDDRIIEANGQKIIRVAQFKQVFGHLYGGDTLNLTIQRAEKTRTVAATLAGELVPYEVPFLGLLPRRGASVVQGMAVRFVFPDSPTDKAGLSQGDQILKYNGLPVIDSRTLADLVGRGRPGDQVSLAYLHDGREATVDVTLASLPNTIVGELSAELIESSATGSIDLNKNVLDDVKAVEAKPAERISIPEGPKTGRFTELLAGYEHSYWAYVPENYNPRRAYGLLVWIHPSGDTLEAIVTKRWKSICDRRGIILVAPKADNLAGWTPGEANFVEGLVAYIREKYTIDTPRIWLHSHGSGAMMASLLVGRQGDVFRGLVLTGAPFVGQVADQEPDFKPQFHFVCGDGDKTLSSVKKTIDALKKRKFAVSFTMVNGGGPKYPEEGEVEQIGRWADCLDRL